MRKAVLLSDVFDRYVAWLRTKQDPVWGSVNVGNAKISSGEEALDALYCFTHQKLKEVRLPFNGRYDSGFLNAAAEDLVRIYVDDSSGRIGGGLTVSLNSSFSDEDRLGLFLDVNFKLGALDVLKRNNRRDHVWETLMGIVYMDDRDSSAAEKYLSMAYRQSPMCPFVLWNRALFWVVNHKYKKPLRYLDRLLSMPNREIAYGCHGEGAMRANRMKNDAVLLRAFCLAHNADFLAARSGVNQFLANRCNKKTGSCFHKSQISYLVAFVNNAKAVVH